MFWNKKTILIVLGLALALIASVARADFTFGEPVNLGPNVNSSAWEWYPSIRADGLEMFFESNRPGGEGTLDIWVTTRATTEDDWGDPTNLGAPVNAPGWQNGPTISADGLELYYSGDYGDGLGLWVTRRTTVSDPWGEPENGSLVNINAIEGGFPSLSSDGLSLFFASAWPKPIDSWDTDLYVSTRPTRDDVWSEPVNLGPTVNGVNSTSLNYCPNISADGLLLVFSSNRHDYSDEDLWMTRRTTIDGPWSEPVNLGPTVNSNRWDNAPEISPDGRTLLFCSNRREGRYGSFDIWQASIDPVVDFNGDGNIDTDDLLIMIDNWETDNSTCDIGPMPWGDGVVNMKDLEVWIKYWEQENMPQEPEDGE